MTKQGFEPKVRWEHLGFSLKEIKSKEVEVFVQEVT